MSYPILYESNATDFFSLGLGTLPDAISPLVTEERNGEFVLDMTYPLHGIRANQIKNNRIIKVDAGHKLTDQRFVIKTVTPTMDNSGNTVITVHAEHVSYLANDLAIKPQVAMTDVNAEQALNMWNSSLTTPNQFTVDSDITTHNSTSWSIDKVENARQALGGVEGSILDVWGGEYRFDNLHISLMSKRGTVSNTLLAYGRNITSFEQEQNIMDTYTSVYPYYVLSGEANEDSTIYTVPNLVVNSDNANKFPNQKTMPLEVSSYLGDIKVGTKPTDASADDKTEYITVQELQSRMTKIAQQYIKNNNIGVPKVSIKVSFVDLSKTANYADVAPLEQLDLCDNVPIKFPDLDIDTTAKVSRVIWNVLTDSYDSLELGNISATLGDKIAEIDQKANKAKETADNIVQVGADGKSTVFRGQDTPTANHIGDLWYKPNGEDTEMYQWDGVSWHFVMSTKDTHDISDKVDQAMQEMADKEKEINGKLESNQIDISQAQKDLEQVKQDTANQLADIRDSVVKDVADAKAQSKDALDKANTVDDKATEALTNAEQALGKAQHNSSTVNTLAGKVSDAETSISQNATDIKSKADKSTVDTLNKTVKSQGTSITQNANAIKSKASSSDVDKLSGRVSTAETTLTQTANGLKGKADKTELDKTNNSLTTLSNNFSTTSSGFQASLSKIDDKVNANKEETNSALSVAKADIKATADNLSTNYTKTTDEHDYVNSQIKQSADKLEASVASVSDVANAEDTNLIFNGSFKNGDNWKLGSLNTYFGVGASVPISAGTYVNFSSPTDVNTALTFIQNPNADVLRSITGNTVTMSIYARCQKNGGQIKVYIRTEDADGNYSYFNSGKAYDLTTAWTRYSMTAKLPTGIKAINLSFHFINIAANVVCYATGAMLNVGNVLLPYSESTLDSDAKIAKLEIDADGIKQTVSNKADTSYVDQKANSLTTTIGRNKTDADNKINANKKDVDNQISQVKQTANSLSSTVANNKTATDKVINANKQSADTQFSNINQTINGVKITVNGKADISQVSQLSNQINLVVKNNNTEHTNLLLNGSFRNGDNWHYSAKVTDEWYGVSSNSPIDNGTYSVFHADDGNARLGQVWDTNYAAKVKGKQVTFSAYARATNAGKFRPYIRTEASDGTYSYFGAGSTNYDVSTGWKRYSVTATLPKDIKEMILNLEFGTTKTGEKYYLTGAMLTLGGQLWPYQDSTKDIVSQINIDESGVLIQGKKIMIDGDATIKNAVIKSSMIDTLDASKITAGTLNAANVNIINMNANNITTGTLKGTNLSMNLNTGEVLFQKGSIKSTNGKLNISVDDGTMAVTDKFGYGALFSEGKIYMTSADNFNNIISGTSKPTVYGAIEATRLGWWNESAGMVMHGSGSVFGITQDNSNTSNTKVSLFSEEITDGRGLFLADKKVYLGGDGQTQTIITSGKKFHRNNSFLHPDRQPFITVGGSIKLPDESSNDIDVPSNGSDILIVGNSIGLNSARINYKSDTWYSGYTDWYLRNYHGDFATVRGKNFVNSSQLSKKTDIKQLDVDKVRNAIRNVDIREYRYKSDIKNGEDKVYASAIIDDVNDTPQYNIPYDWVTSDGTGRDDGTATGYLIVTTQDLYNQIDELKAEIKQLKGE